MSCIKTYSGTMFDPLNPNPEQIYITDIAHALSMLCKANGHGRNFYSVGQHCINCMKEASARGCSRKVQLACLLHDASEAYLSDIIRPVKQNFPQYMKIEKKLQETIWNQYLGETLTQEEETQVRDINDTLLYYEFLKLMNTKLTDIVPKMDSLPEFQFISFSECENQYLQFFYYLTNKNQYKVADKSAEYQALIKKVRMSYNVYDGPLDGKNPRLSWCDSCQEINLWTYWQGRGNLNAKILPVGQDWGCIYSEEAEQCIRKIELANKGDTCNYMQGNTNPTDRNLVTLFQKALGLDVLKPCPELFFTNFVLGYRNKGTSGGFKKTGLPMIRDFFESWQKLLSPE